MSEINNMMNFSDLMSENENLKPLMEIVETIMGIPDESLTETYVDMMKGMIGGSLTNKVKEEAISSIIQGFEEANYSPAAALQIVKSLKNELNNYVDSLKPTEQKRDLLNSIFNVFNDIFDEAVQRYHSYDIVLPIKLAEGAQIPTYAHESDACADLYANETITIKAHSLGNMVHTGIQIALPDNWEAFVRSRSGMAAKTPLRISNAVGVIDTDYRGEVMVLFDNISDSDYTINTGDHIAQLEVRPVHRFKALKCDILPATERADGGFGSTGK
jgi:dUTP pyrophosphatase